MFATAWGLRESCTTLRGRMKRRSVELEKVTVDVQDRSVARFRFAGRVMALPLGSLTQPIDAGSALSLLSV